MIGSYGILIFFSNYYLVLLGMGIFGLGDGLGNLSGIKNAWKYFPNNKGLVNGIIIGGLGLSSSVFTPLADYIINKDGKKPNNDGFYDKEISDCPIHPFFEIIPISELTEETQHFADIEKLFGFINHMENVDNSKK